MINTVWESRAWQSDMQLIGKVALSATAVFILALAYRFYKLRKLETAGPNDKCDPGCVTEKITSVETPLRDHIGDETGNLRFRCVHNNLQNSSLTDHGNKNLADVSVTARQAQEGLLIADVTCKDQSGLKNDPLQSQHQTRDHTHNRDGEKTSKAESKDCRRQEPEGGEMQEKSELAKGSLEQDSENHDHERGEKHHRDLSTERQDDIITDDGPTHTWNLREHMLASNSRVFTDEVDHHYQVRGHQSPLTDLLSSTEYGDKSVIAEQEPTNDDDTKNKAKEKVTHLISSFNNNQEKEDQEDSDTQPQEIQRSVSPPVTASSPFYNQPDSGTVQLGPTNDDDTKDNAKVGDTYLINSFNNNQEKEDQDDKDIQRHNHSPSVTASSTLSNQPDEDSGGVVQPQEIQGNGSPPVTASSLFSNQPDEDSGGVVQSGTIVEEDTKDKVKEEVTQLQNSFNDIQEKETQEDNNTQHHNLSPSVTASSPFSKQPNEDSGGVVQSESKDDEDTKDKAEEEATQLQNSFNDFQKEDQVDTNTQHHNLGPSALASSPSSNQPDKNSGGIVQSGPNTYHISMDGGSTLDVHLELGNCYDVLCLAKKNNYNVLIAAAYKIMSDNYLEVLQNPNIYGRLNATERDLILDGRMKGRRFVVVADIDTQSINTSANQSSLSYYDSDCDQWHALSHIPSEAVSRGCSMATLFNYIFIILGSDGLDRQMKPTKRVLCYNPLTDTWKEVASLKEARPHCKLVSLDGCLYAIGGECLHTVEKYDPRQNRWSYIAPLPNDTFAVAHMATAYDEEIYVTGGTIRYMLLRYNLREKIWKNSHISGSKDRTTEIVVANNFLYRFDLNRSMGISVHRCNIRARIWYECATYALPYPSPFQCVVIDNNIHCISRNFHLRFLADEVSPKFMELDLQTVPLPKGILYPLVLVLAVK